MKQDTSHWTLIFDIIRAGLSRRSEDVARTAQELAEHVEHPMVGAGEPQVAKRIRSILTESPQRWIHSGTSGNRVTPSATSGNAGAFMAVSGAPGPVDSESRSPFVDELAMPTIERPILPEDAAAELERFVELWHYRDDVARAGIPAPRTLLLYGPPGCGKTTAARYVAAMLDLPLLTVRLDAVISSYLGTTAKNLRTVFDYAAHRGGVLFLDEFDALAKMRDDANEVGEIKRIVNGLIQNLDGYPDMPLIAATNHEHLLDPAIWRRFDSVIALPLPGQDEREALLRLFVERDSPASFQAENTATRKPTSTSGRTLRAASVDPEHQRMPTPITNSSSSAPRVTTGSLDHEELALLAQLTTSCSGADLERFVVRARQEMVLAHLRSRRGIWASSQASLAAQLAIEIWRARDPGGSAASMATIERASGTVRPALVHFIDDQVRERPSAREISALTGIPVSTVARIRQQRDRGLQNISLREGQEVDIP